MTRNSLWMTFAWAFAHVGCTLDRSPELELGVQHDELVTSTIAVSMGFPNGVAPRSVGIAGLDTVRINDRATIVAATGMSLVTKLGAGELNVGVDTHVDNLSGNGTVFLRDRACAHGNVIAQTYQTQNNVQVMGQLSVGGTLARTDFPISLSATGSGASVWLEPDQQAVLTQGRYQDVRLASRAKLTLAGGNYVLSSLQLEPGSTLTLDETLGPVMVGVTGFLKLAGSVVHAGSQRPQFLLVASAGGTVSVESPFSGSLLAPNAYLNVLPSNVTHLASFWGKSVEVHQGSTVQVTTPCFQSRCFWEPVQSTLAVAHERAFSTVGGDLLAAAAFASSLIPRINAMVASLDNATPDQRISIVNGAEFTSIMQGFDQVIASAGLAVASGRALQTMALGRIAKNIEFALSRAATCYPPNGTTPPPAQVASNALGGFGPALSPAIPADPATVQQHLLNNQAAVRTALAQSVSLTNQAIAVTRDLSACDLEQYRANANAYSAAGQTADQSGLSRDDLSGVQSEFDRAREEVRQRREEYKARLQAAQQAGNSTMQILIAIVKEAARQRDIGSNNMR